MYCLNFSVLTVSAWLVLTAPTLAPSGGTFLVTAASSSSFPGNCPADCSCRWFDGKRGAQCHSRHLVALPAGLSEDLQTLDVSRSSLERLDKDAFLLIGLQHLHRFLARDAGIQHVHRHAFRGVLGLNMVDLSDNGISKLDTELFADNQKLQHITLSGNPLQSLGRYQFPPLQLLQSLKLARCRLTSISAKAFANLASLQRLDLSANRLATLESDVLQSLGQLNSLQLGDNPWRCDCHLRLFRDWLIDRNLYMSDAQCSEPERLASKRWNQAASEQFACRPQIHVPQPTVVARRGANVTLRCQISANPAPTANWVQGGRVLANGTQLGSHSGMSGSDGSSQRYTILSDGTVNHWINLTIARASDRDLGHYLCIGFNAGGVVERNVSLVFDASAIGSAGEDGSDGGGIPGIQRRLSSSLLAGLLAAAACLLFLLLMITCVCCCCWGGRKQRAASEQAPAGSISNAGFTTMLSNSACGGGETGASGGVMVIGGGRRGDDKLVGAPLLSSTPCGVSGGYQKLPQYDVSDLAEMRVYRTGSGSSSGNASGLFPAAGDSATLRRLSLPNGPMNMSSMGSGDFPDLLHVPHSPPSPPSSSLPPPSSLPLAPCSATSGGAARLAQLELQRRHLLNYTPPRALLLNGNGNGPARPGYVTLPRRPRTPSWGANTTTASPSGVGGASVSLVADPVYDSLGPRTTVDGSSRLNLNQSSSSDSQSKHNLSSNGKENGCGGLPQRGTMGCGDQISQPYYMHVEPTPPPPPEFSTLPRNIRLSTLSPLAAPALSENQRPTDNGVGVGSSLAMRPRSLSTDIIEPLQEAPDEVDEPPQADLTHSSTCSVGDSGPSAVRSRDRNKVRFSDDGVNGATNGQHLATVGASNGQSTKLKPVPPPKPVPKKPIPPPVLPKPQLNGSTTAPLREDGTEV